MCFELHLILGRINVFLTWDIFLYQSSSHRSSIKDLQTILLFVVALDLVFLRSQGRREAIAPSTGLYTTAASTEEIPIIEKGTFLGSQAHSSPESSPDVTLGWLPMVVMLFDTPRLINYSQI